VGQQIFTFFCAREGWSYSCSTRSILILWLSFYYSHFFAALLLYVRSSLSSTSYCHQIFLGFFLFICFCYFVIIGAHPSFYSCTKFITWLDEALFLWSNITCISVIKHHLYFCDLNHIYFCDQTSLVFLWSNITTCLLSNHSPINFVIHHRAWFLCSSQLILHSDDHQRLHNWAETLRVRECHFLEFLLLRV